MAKIPVINLDVWHQQEDMRQLPSTETPNIAFFSSIRNQSLDFKQLTQTKLNALSSDYPNEHVS